MSQEHKLTLSRKKWCLWLAGLTSVPYVTGNISAPVIPGLIDTSALCVAIALVVLWDRYEANFADTGTTRRAKIRGTLIAIGLYSMLVLTVIESISVIRGRDPLESELIIELSEWLSLVEFACFALSALEWVLASDDANHEDPLSRSHRPTLFCMGAILPNAPARHRLDNLNSNCIPLDDRQRRPHLGHYSQQVGLPVGDYTKG